MKSNSLLPTWAPRVKPYLIRQLYADDDQGIHDEDLINKVGWKLFFRCESFINAMEAQQGRARCPKCATVVLHDLNSKAVLRCPTCNWECSWRDYSRTYQNQQLNGGPEVVGLFQDYLDRFPQAKTYPEKMQLIDALIHGFHHFLRSGRTRRPVGVNLIDGDCQYVTEFLDRLACGPDSTPGLGQSQAEWHEKIRSYKGQRERKNR